MMEVWDVFRPLTPAQIERAKARLAEHDVRPEDCTCFRCPEQINNRCSLQWDAYNTDGDCLAEK